MNVVEPIFLQSENKPSELALCAPGTDFNIVSYARLRRSVNSICRRLISTGIAARDRFAGTDEQRAEFIRDINHTGIGDFRSFIRFTANVMAEIARLEKLLEPQPVGNVRPPPALDGPSRRYHTMEIR